MLADFMLREKEPVPRQAALNKMRALEAEKARIAQTLHPVSAPEGSAVPENNPVPAAADTPFSEPASARPGRSQPLPGQLPADRQTIRQLLDHGRFDEVLRIAAQESQEDPTNPRPYLLMADVFLLLHKYERAEEQLLRTLELAPEMAIVYNKLGRVYEIQGRTADALRMYRQQVLVTPPGEQREETEQRIHELEQTP
jgi:tetratricopeptide (TPR) repeat protein